MKIPAWKASGAVRNGKPSRRGDGRAAALISATADRTAILMTKYVIGPHPESFLARRGRQARGGIYIRRPQPDLEAR